MNNGAVRKNTGDLSERVQQKLSAPTQRSSVVPKEPKSTDAYRLASVTLSNTAARAVKSIVSKQTASGSALAKARKLRRDFQDTRIPEIKRIFMLPKWGVELTKLSQVARGKEAIAGAKALRKVMRVRIPGVASNAPTAPLRAGLQLQNAVLHAAAILHLRILVNMNVLPQIEINASARAACDFFKAKNRFNSGAISEALGLLVDIWKITPNKSGLSFSADSIVSNLFKYRNPAVVEKAMLTFMNHMAKHLPSHALKAALLAMQDVQKNGITYYDPNLKRNATFKANNIEHVIKQAIPILQKLIAAKQRP